MAAAALATRARPHSDEHYAAKLAYEYDVRSNRKGVSRGLLDNDTDALDAIGIRLADTAVAIVTAARRASFISERIAIVEQFEIMADTLDGALGGLGGEVARQAGRVHLMQRGL